MVSLIAVNAQKGEFLVRLYQGYMLSAEAHDLVDEISYYSAFSYNGIVSNSAFSC